MIVKPDIVSVFQREGAEFQQKGSSLWTRCLLHPEKTASCKVDPERQTFRCFGCHAAGDVLSFIQAKRKCSFKDALEILEIDKGKPYRPDPRETEKKHLVKAFNLWCRDYGNGLARELRTLRGIVAGIRTPEDMEQRGWAYDEISTLEYKLDVLSYGSDEAKYIIRKEATANG
jgi:hypothetical protein